MKAGDLLPLCRPANGAMPCTYDGLGCIDEAHCKRDINAETLREFGCVKHQRAQKEVKHD